jgi:hypothetical protein
MEKIGKHDRPLECRSEAKGAVRRDGTRDCDKENNRSLRLSTVCTQLKTTSLPCFAGRTLTLLMFRSVRSSYSLMACWSFSASSGMDEDAAEV